MIGANEDRRLRIDYDEYGRAQPLFLYRDSCSTGAAWCPEMNVWNGQFRCVTTSLFGYVRRAETELLQGGSVIEQ
jgi:hypothetical protein